VQGSPVMLQLQVGRWRCGNRRCPRKIFIERVPVGRALGTTNHFSRSVVSKAVFRSTKTASSPRLTNSSLVE
jgi:hypothetical protein